MAGSKLLQTSLHLYAYLLRKVRLLPAEVQPYYRNYIRQNFRQHADEDDPENTRIMTSTAISDMDWLLAKTEKLQHFLMYPGSVNMLNSLPATEKQVIVM
ncbi:LYR motif-containing protein 9 [Echinococcus granulosus]|uniref:LYR motif-containing protein 9 n=1 Tax=Echinococcus granulosus TaxID=6210 RepID=A0A068WQM2_ECHGR|nr:LYR motif-containing protein 9 [Echinococcus granulosus]CDS19960.1 expressed protein [Echinococcus granulosus]